MPVLTLCTNIDGIIHNAHFCVWIPSLDISVWNWAVLLFIHSLCFTEFCGGNIPLRFIHSTAYMPTDSSGCCIKGKIIIIFKVTYKEKIFYYEIKWAFWVAWLTMNVYKEKSILVLLGETLHWFAELMIKYFQRC